MSGGVWAMKPVASSALLSSMMGFTAEFVRGGKMGLPGARGDFGEAVPDTIVSARSRAFCFKRQSSWVSASLFQRFWLMN